MSFIEKVIFGARLRLNWSVLPIFCVSIEFWTKLKIEIAFFHVFFSVLYVFFSARTGGLLSLFMGFSLISIVEIVYFLTIRPYCNFKRKNEEKYRPNNNRWKRMFQRFQKIKSRRIDFLVTSTQNTTLKIENPVLDKSSD